MEVVSNNEIQRKCIERPVCVLELLDQVLTEHVCVTLFYVTPTPASHIAEGWSGDLYVSMVCGCMVIACPFDKITSGHAYSH